MATVAAMNKPSSKSRVSARTAPQIVSDVKLAVVRLAGRGMIFRNRKLGIEGFLGSILLEVLSQSDDQIQAILERRLPEVERLFDESGTTISEVQEGVGIKVVKAGPTRGKRAPKKKDESA